MLEFPEVSTMARQLTETVSGSAVADVRPPTKPHKFCRFGGAPAEYGDKLRGCKIAGAEGFGLFVELLFDNGLGLCFNDGVNVRLVGKKDAPKEYQLLLLLEDGRALAFTVAMYGGIVLHGKEYDEPYYLKSRNAVPPSAPGLAAYFEAAFNACKPSLSVKAFLAAEQRFPGLGNGVLQDILFAAGIHPKRKARSLSKAEKEKLLGCVISVPEEMTARGGRDTEKDLFGRAGGYATKLSKNTLGKGCPRCGGPITKEAYLGGAVYYCPHCQPLTAAENTPLLETERLILRKFTPDDAEALLELLRDEETNAFLPWFPLKTMAEAERFLKERFLDWYAAPSAYRYAVCLKSGGGPIGYVWLSDDESHDFGYGLKRELWGKGIVTEAALAAVEILKRAGLKYITATHDLNNPAGGRVMQKLGMTYRYSYVEQWQPKDISVTFRMYQLNLDGMDGRVYMGYWNKYKNHFKEVVL